MRLGKCKVAIVLNPRIAVTMIVVYFIGIEPVQQTLEMIETMTVMPTNRGIECRRQLSRIFFVVDSAQKGLPLAQDVSDGGVQRRLLHRRAPITGIIRRLMKRTTAEQIAVATARKNRNPLSSITTIPSTVR